MSSRVLIVAHQQRREAVELVRLATAWLVDHGHEAWLVPDDAAALELPELGRAADPATAELIVCLGGDGTMLRAVQLLRGAPVPIIGVNVGLLGYLNEVEPDGMLPALEQYFGVAARQHDRDHEGGPSAAAIDGSWRIEERMMVDAVVRRAGSAEVERWTALNEGVVEKEEPGHTVRLAVSIDGAAFTSYAADGLIIATPTGSTAYSLSARGPVVSPRHRALLLTPVSPHGLFDRSLVLDPEEQVDIEVLGHRRVVLSIDGQRAAALGEGDTVAFVASRATARFVRFGRRRFHQILKTKFGLADR